MDAAVERGWLWSGCAVTQLRDQAGLRHVWVLAHAYCLGWRDALNNGDN